VYRPFADNGEIVARVVAQDSTSPLAKAGLMLRSSVDPASPHVILNVMPDGGLELMARFAEGQDTLFIAGGQAAATPWLKLVRSGTEVTGLHSGDGLTWTSIGSVVLESMPSDLIAGLAVTSHEPAVLNHAIFDSVRVSSHAHNLLMFESFEEYGPTLGPLPELGPIGWISDHGFRQTPAKAETNQPHWGTRNGACWTIEYLDCGLYQDVVAPVTGSYTLRLFANADRAGGLVGANVNGTLAAYRDLEVRGFRNYGSPYSMSFEASAGDMIRVWMYSPAAPGYVVIDDVSVMLDRTLVVTEGEWIFGPFRSVPFGRFTLRGEEFLIEGSYDSGEVEVMSACGDGLECMPGQVVGLFSSFENYRPQVQATYAPGGATIAKRSWGCTSVPCETVLDFGGELHLAGGVVTLPTPTYDGEPSTVVSMTAPFTLSGSLKGFEIGTFDAATGFVPRSAPKLVFDLPLAGRGTATLELLSTPLFGKRMWFYRLRYAFEPEQIPGARSYGLFSGFVVMHLVDVDAIQSIEQRAAERADREIRLQRAIAAGDDPDMAIVVRGRRVAATRLFGQQRKEPALRVSAQIPDRIDEQRPARRTLEPIVDVTTVHCQTSGGNGLAAHGHEWTVTVRAAIVKRPRPSRPIGRIAGRHHYVDRGTCRQVRVLDPLQAEIHGRRGDRRHGVDAAHETFTSMVFGFALADFGRCTLSTPSLNSAAIFCGSTSLGSASRRSNWP
jgi:hypothetical protein